MGENDFVAVVGGGGHGKRKAIAQHVWERRMLDSCMCMPVLFGDQRTSPRDLNRTEAVKVLQVTLK